MYIRRPKLKTKYINLYCNNHLYNADDICLLAPSASAMQSLLDVCML